MAAVCACVELGIADETIEKGVLTFRPLQHRMEFVAEIDGVKYFDDSIATIPEAAIAAARALHPVGTMILGGFDRGVDYTALCRFLLNSEIANYIFIDEAGVRMRALYVELGGDESKTFQVDSMKEAVQLARKKTAPGQACLLSPAAASYGRYLNFKERGNEFRKFLTEQDSD
jgi:UDP-N-acetylmuramoylalanine--D-glutamate ligase